tara:strand:+ start:1267 stop:1458 length:192 start_codon:yes stop_codon:yes gene_type:complete
MSKIGNYIVGRGEEVASHKYMKSLEGSYEPSISGYKEPVSWEDMTSEEYDEYRQNWMNKYTND